MTPQAIKAGHQGGKERKPPSATPTQRIGWRGVALEVPEDWSLTSVSGEGPNGYLRVESPDALFLQVKWWERRGIVSVPDALDTYVRDLKKRARKRGRLPGLGKKEGDLEFKRSPRQLAGIRPGHQAPITYSWTGEQRAYGVIWHCGECRRLVIAELVGRPEDDFRGAGAILSSIREHPESGWNPWGMYGLYIETPAQFQLERYRLLTGYMRLAFRHRSRTLLVQRWGLSDVILKETHLREWYDYQERTALSRYRYRYEEAEVRGHPALRLLGRERVMPGLFKALNQLTAFSRPALYLEGYLWECPECKKIFAITAQTGKRDDTLARVMERFHCH